MSKLHIKKGDTVYVNAGNDRGKTGRVLRVIVDKQRALVEGINMGHQYCVCHFCNVHLKLPY